MTPQDNDDHRKRKRIEDYRVAHRKFSKSASNAARQLSFAGIALIWIFKVDNGISLTVPADLQYPALLLAAALAFDLLHYMIGTLVWYFFYRYHEKRNIKEEEKIDAPVELTIIIDTFFWLKLIFVIAAYIMIVNYLRILVVTS